MPSDAPFPLNSRVVAYLRDSGGEDQDLSVAQQEAFVRGWCQQNNLVLTAIFADVATPGSSTIGRDQFRKLIDHFHNPDCPDAGVILWKFSRFSRSMDDAQFYRADLRRRGFIVHSIQDNIPDTTDGRIYEALIDWMNNKFLEDLSMDVKRGLHHLVTTYGALPGTPPRGFMREPVAIGSRRDGSPHTACRWSPDPEKWDLCLQAWTMRAQGIPVRRIHKELHLFGSINSYSTFFKNPLYLGELHYGDLVIKDYTTPMVTREIWDIVQELNQANSAGHSPLHRRTNDRHPRRENSTFVLSGLLHCPRCGSLMNGMSVRSTKSGLFEYYLCSNANSKGDCDARRVPKATIETLVIEKILEYVLDPEAVKERDKEMALAQADNPKRIKKALEGCNARLANNARRIENVTNRLAEEKKPPQSLLAKLHELELEHLTLSAEKERLKSMQNHETVFVRNPEQIQKMVDGFNYSMTHGTLEEKRDAVRSLVVRVAAERDGDFIRGIVRFFNPTDEKRGFMSMAGGTVEAPEYRHKIFTFEFCVKIKQKSQ